VDTDPIIKAKTKILDQLRIENKITVPICKREVISMDFTKESTKDLPNHGFDKEMPTCWILEGLVMYLKKEDNQKLLEELSDLSAAGSYVIINFLANNPACQSDFID